MKNQVEYFRKLGLFLKPEGRIVILEYKRAKPFTFRGIFGHHVPEENIIEEMKKAG